MSKFRNRISAVSEGVRIALDAVRSNKVRAGLTILGIAVGVFVVVIISGAIHGINKSVEDDFASAGPTAFFVSRYPISFEPCDGSENTCKWLRNPPIRSNETAALRRLSSVGAVGEQINWSTSVKYYDRELPSVSIEGISFEVIDISAQDIDPGRAFTAAEARTASRVAIISTVTAERVFGESDPLGKMLQLGKVPFEVIGVFEDKSSFLRGGDQPRVVVPLLASVRYLGARTSGMNLTIKPHDGFTRDEAIDDVTATLRGVRGQRPADESSFAILTQDQLYDTYNQIFGMFFLVMLSLSSVGLLVGGVGVVAIMMISVTERTREIGVRKALGATRGTILWQFLVEAVTLTFIGATVGLVLGWGGTALIRSLTPIQASIPPMAVVAALTASCITGILFGLIPANKAASLDPVEALRYE